MYSRILLIIVLLFCFCNSVSAYDIDVSVDKEIEQKYDSDKLNKDMGISGTSSQTAKKSTKKAPKITPSFDSHIPTVSGSVSRTTASNSSKSGIKIPAGAKFRVKSSNSVSGWSGVNTPLSFTSISSVSFNSLTIPVGTVFKGYVVNSHAGQITGNGGLVEINITSMIYNGKTVQVNGKITKANSKNIFLNNIKGKRQYISSVTNQIKKGVNIYNKVQSVSAALPSNPLAKIAYPISPIVGAAATLGNTVVSPIIAVFKKGQNISLPAGTIFEIKLTNDAYVN